MRSRSQNSFSLRHRVESQAHIQTWSPNRIHYLHHLPRPILHPLHLIPTNRLLSCQNLEVPANEHFRCCFSAIQPARFRHPLRLRGYSLGQQILGWPEPPHSTPIATSSFHLSSIAGSSSIAQRASFLFPPVCGFLTLFVLPHRVALI